MPDLAAVDHALAQRHPGAVARLVELLRVPSISTDPSNAPAMHQAAEWTLAHLRSIGLTAELWPTAGWPAVFGQTTPTDPSRPTLLVYGHYDVQPAGDLARWTHPPFEPHVDRVTGRITARGAADNKGQFFLQLCAIEAWLAAIGGTPVNVKVLIEGEEEIGSPNLRPLLRDRRDALACDLVVVSDTPLWRPGRPAVSLGTRGITGLEVIVTGPNRDLHSGMYGGSVPNPIAALARLLASVHDDTGRIAVPGFYDDVAPIPDHLRRHWRDLEADLSGEPALLGCLFAGERGFGVLERRWLRPTVEFNGITGGYQGPGSNTIVPSRASAKLTARLVPDQDPDRVQALLRDHLAAAAGRTGVGVEFVLRKSGARAYSIPADHPAVGGAARALEVVYGVRPVTVREGLSLPILPMFREELGADTVLLGFCDPVCNAHSFDEFFDAADLLRGARTAARFFAECAALPRRR